MFRDYDDVVADARERRKGLQVLRLRTPRRSLCCLEQGRSWYKLVPVAKAARIVTLRLSKLVYTPSTTSIYEQTRYTN